MAGRGRLSSIDLLPEEAEDDIVWACQELAARKRTQEDIRFELNDRLEAKGLEGISKSAFNRKAMRLAAAQRRMSEARAMFDGLASQFTAEDVDENTVILGEFIKTLIVELVDDQSGTKTPKQAMELARAFHATVSAQKISTDRRRKIEAEFAAKASKAVEDAGKAAGLSADRIAQLRREFLGVAT
ncbi:DUF3486 family protein [Amorphus coralli]|uniref:DUF3486 family protein n=1 Tax=Amorphus coralli TaxID=340680 RepID=UPI000363BB0F|nr:DUF3486 family protein [Amorphus coralli]